MDWYLNKGEVFCECFGENGLMFVNFFYVVLNIIDFLIVFLKFFFKD